MNPAAILGLIGTVVGLVRALPQLHIIIKSRKAAGVSIDSTAVSSLVSMAWALYGLLTHQPFVSLATGSSAVIFLLITLFSIKYGRSPREFRVAPIWLALLTLTALLGGITGLGILLPLSVLACNLPQLKTAWQETDLSELSLGTWLFSLSDGIIWTSYALLMDDVPILAYGLLQGITSIAILTFKLGKARTKLPTKS